MNAWNALQTRLRMAIPGHAEKRKKEFLELCNNTDLELPEYTKDDITWLLQHKAHEIFASFNLRRYHDVLRNADCKAAILSNPNNARLLERFCYQALQIATTSMTDYYYIRTVLDVLPQENKQRLEKHIVEFIENKSSIHVEECVYLSIYQQFAYNQGKQEWFHDWSKSIFEKNVDHIMGYILDMHNARYPLLLDVYHPTMNDEEHMLRYILILNEKHLKYIHVVSKVDDEYQRMIRRVDRLVDCWKKPASKKLKLAIDMARTVIGQKYQYTHSNVDDSWIRYCCNRIVFTDVQPPASNLDRRVQMFVELMDINNAPMDFYEAMHRWEQLHAMNHEHIQPLEIDSNTLDTMLEKP